MATYKEIEDDLVTCPYDKNHRIARRRYQIHVSQCGLKPGAPKLEICKYNSMHRFASLKLHYLTCPDAKQALRAAVEIAKNATNQDLGSSSRTSAGLPKKLEVVGRKPGDPEGDVWAEEGIRDGIVPFEMKGLRKETVDYEALCDIEKHINNVQLQRLDPAERRLVYKTREDRLKVREEENRKKTQVLQKETVDMGVDAATDSGQAISKGTSSRHYPYNQVTRPAAVAKVEKEVVRMPIGIEMPIDDRRGKHFMPKDPPDELPSYSQE